MAYISKIAIGNSTYDLKGYPTLIPCAYCNTAAATAAKTASCTDYTLTSKTYLHVLIKTANSSAGKITLNVNGKGAKDIWINGAVSSASNYTLPAGSYITYYDGSKYLFRTDGKLVTSDLIADSVTGVKGNAESSYRTGNVNLTPANIGALALSGGRLTGSLYTKAVMGSADATAADNNVTDTVWQPTIEGQDSNNRRITRLETSVYSDGNISLGMNIRQWYKNGDTATVKATKGLKLTMNKAGTLSAEMDAASFKIGNCTLNSPNSVGAVTLPAKYGTLLVQDDLRMYNDFFGCQNLMRYPSQHTTKTQNGLTFTDNGDGSVTVTGSATADTTYYFAVRGNNTWQILLPAGNYTLSGCPSGGSSSTYSIYCNTYKQGTTTGGSGMRDSGSGATVTYDYDVSLGCYIDIKKNIAFPNGIVFRPVLYRTDLISVSAGELYAQTNRQLTITKADYSQIATYEKTTSASKAYTKNELMILRGELYRVTAAISSGGTIVTSGSSANVTSTTLSAEIKAIRNTLNI